MRYSKTGKYRTHCRGDHDPNRLENGQEGQQATFALWNELESDGRVDGNVTLQSSFSKGAIKV